MAMATSDDSTKLNAFMERLKEYQSLWSKPKDGGLTIGRGPTSVIIGGRAADQEQDLENLREQLVRESGYFKPVVVDLTNKQFGTMFGTSFDLWSTALQKDANPPVKEWALQAVIDSCNEAIGRLKAGAILPQPKASTVPPKAFVAHGGMTKALARLCEFLRALGVEPLVVELTASQVRSVDRQVDKRVKDSDCGIVFATRGGIRDVRTGKELPRLNVIDEFARLRGQFPDKVVILLEKGVDFPSNVSDLVHERFTRGNLEKAFLKVAMELKAFGILRAQRPGH